MFSRFSECVTVTDAIINSLRIENQISNEQTKWQQQYNSWQKKHTQNHKIKNKGTGMKRTATNSNENETERTNEKERIKYVTTAISKSIYSWELIFIRPIRFGAHTNNFIFLILIHHHMIWLLVVFLFICKMALMQWMLLLFLLLFGFVFVVLKWLINLMHITSCVICP